LSETQKKKMDLSQNVRRYSKMISATLTILQVLFLVTSRQTNDVSLTQS